MRPLPTSQEAAISINGSKYEKGRKVFPTALNKPALMNAMPKFLNVTNKSFLDILSFLVNLYKAKLAEGFEKTFKKNGPSEYDYSEEVILCNQFVFSSLFSL